MKIPEYWQHNPELQDLSGNTVAILCAKNKIIPSEKWKYNILIQNNNKNTVALCLA